MVIKGTRDKVYKVNEERLAENLAHYRDFVNCFGANLPIQAMCLPKRIENVLLRDGFDRIYDLLYKDFREVKGLGKAGFELIVSRLDEFGTIRI